jgi:hypothetical protein
MLTLSVFMGQNPRVWNKFEWTQVEGSLTQDEIGFRIQPHGLRGMTVFLMLTSFGLNFVGFTIFFASMSTTGLGGEIFATPFLVGGAVTFHRFLFMLKGTTTFNMNRHEITLSRSLFGVNRGKTRLVSNLQSIELMVVYRMNKQPRHGVGLKFSNAKPLKFGVTLSSVEQNWMISEMSRFLQS